MGKRRVHWGLWGPADQPCSIHLCDTRLKADNCAAPNVDLAGPQRGPSRSLGWRPQCHLLRRRELTETKVSRTYRTVGFDWYNGSPDPNVGADTFSARWTGQGETPREASHLHYHGRRRGVPARERQTPDRNRGLGSSAGFPVVKSSRCAPLLGRFRYSRHLRSV